MTEITLAIKILDWVMTVIPATIDGIMQVKALRDQLQAKHDAGETMTSADIWALVGEMKAIDDEIQKL